MELASGSVELASSSVELASVATGTDFLTSPNLGLCSLLTDLVSLAGTINFIARFNLTHLAQKQLPSSYLFLNRRFNNKLLKLDRVHKYLIQTPAWAI